MSNVYERIKTGECVYQVITYLTESEKHNLKTYCSANKTTMSNYIRTLILNNINNTNEQRH